MSKAETYLILKYGDMMSALASWLKNQTPDNEFTPEEQVAIAKYYKKKFSNLELQSTKEVIEKYDSE